MVGALGKLIKSGGVKGLGKTAKKATMFSARTLGKAIRFAGGRDNAPIIDTMADKLSTFKFGRKRRKKKGGDETPTEVIPSGVEKGNGGDTGKTGNEDITQQQSQHHQEDISQQQQNHQEVMDNHVKDKIQNDLDKKKREIDDAVNTNIQKQMLAKLHDIDEKLEDGALAGNDKGKKEKGGGLLDTLTSMLMGIAGMGMASKFGGMLMKGGKGLWKGLKGIGSAVLNPRRTMKSLAKGAVKHSSSIAKGAMTLGAGVASKVPIASAKNIAKGATKGAKIASSVGKNVLKSGIKKIPILGALAGIGFGIKRAMEGDWTGAGLEVASGLASTVPGLGTATSVGIDAGLIARDMKREKEAEIAEKAIENQLGDKYKTKSEIYRDLQTSDEFKTTKMEDVEKRVDQLSKNVSVMDNNNVTNTNNINRVVDTLDKQSSVDQSRSFNERFEKYRDKEVYLSKLKEIEDSDVNINKIANKNVDLRKVVSNEDIIKDISTDIMSDMEAIAQYNIDNNFNNPQQQPIVINQPPQQQQKKEIVQGGGSSGATAPLLVGAIDSTIRAIHYNIISKGTV